MKAIILSNGSIPEPELVYKEKESSDMIICADGGAIWAKELNIIPKVILGDMDSISMEARHYFTEKGTVLIEYPKEKDETDTQISVDFALEQGADDITILGGSGSRIDHTYGNILLLVRICQKGKKGKILDKNNEIYVSNGTFSMIGNPGQILSILPLGENVIISKTEGLYYPIKNKQLPIDYPYGVSNVFTQKEVLIEVKSGWAIIIRARD